LRRAPKGFALWTPTIFSRKNRVKASSSPAGGTKVFGIRKLSSTLHCCNYINKNLENLGLFFLANCSMVFRPYLPTINVKTLFL